MKTFLTALTIVCLSVISILAIAAPATPPKSTTTVADLQMLSASLFSVSGYIADGNRIVFDRQYSNAVDAYDAIKLMNPGENFGIVRDGRTLAVEARQPIAAGDSISFRFTNLRAQEYRLELEPQNLGGYNIKAELVDQFLNTRQLISLTDSNHLRIRFTSDPASMAHGRLLIVFSKPVINEPFHFVSFSATAGLGKTAAISWSVSGESDVIEYLVQHSKDGLNFSDMAVVKAESSGFTDHKYLYNNAAANSNENFYRVISVASAGSRTISDVAKFVLPIEAVSSVYPNPVANRSFHLVTGNLQPGNYSITLASPIGQVLQTNTVTVTTDSLNEVVSLSSLVKPGIYHLTLRSARGIHATHVVLIQ